MSKNSWKLKSTRSRAGRALLHTLCLLRGGKPGWHLAGLWRELVKPAKRSRRRMLLWLTFGAAISAQAQPFYSELFRPQFHFTPEKNWMNDPNGLVFYQGEYHLFYQYNPFDEKWGHMSWGHAVSRDLVHWQHLPLALSEAEGTMIFSGSAVVDWENTSGFGKDGKPPLVAIYTGHRPADGIESQCIAFSNDKGRTWTKYSGNPVLSLNARDFRDPKVQWHSSSRRWVMTVALSAQHKIRFYSSPDLKEWRLLSEFGPAGAVTGVWECPDLFELAVPGRREKHWVLVVNVGSGSVAGGSGGQYFLGHFDGTNFTQETRQAVATLWVDYGRDYYAAVSWNDVPRSDGRRLWLGWMSNTEYAGDVPTSPWRSIMSLPREVALRQTSEGLRLVQTPVGELEKLRTKKHSFRGGDITAANGWLAQQNIKGAGLEFAIQLTPTKGVQGLKVFKGEGHETIIAVDADQGTVFIDRRNSGQVGFHPRFAAIHKAPLPHGEKLQLRLFLDACSLELFVNNGERVFTELVFPAPASQGIEFFSSAPGQKLGPVQVWNLKSAWR